MALLYYTGQDVGLTATVLDDDDTPALGDLTVTLAVTDPTGTATTPATVPTGGGGYAAVVPAVTAPGTWLYRWTAVGTDVNWASEGQFTVRQLGVETIVDLASVKAHLNMPTNDSRQDAELQGFILAAGDLARDVTGPILPETHTEWHDGGSPTITLDWGPLVSVASVTEYLDSATFPLTEQPLGSGSMDAYGYSVDLDHGQIARRAAGGNIVFPPGTKNVRVVYTAGRGGSIPYAVRLGALELIRHLWQMTQQPAGRTWRGGGTLDTDGGTPYPSGFALPNRVLELWAPYRREPGIA